jgi:hypothetical protein
VLRRFVRRSAVHVRTVTVGLALGHQQRGQTMSIHIATLSAYPIKEELGGGFRGVFFVRATKERFASEVMPTLEAAKYWTKCKAHEAYAARGYTLAYLRMPRGKYQSNVWVAA